MAKKTNKTHKLRGSREHGRGMKKGRGAGLRGGKGQAGWKHKKLHFLLYDKDRIRGARNIGFFRHAQDTAPEQTITLERLDESAEAWAGEGKAARAEQGFAVDLGSLGFDKLLGTGQVHRKLAITVPRASPSAVAKVQAAGGSVNQTAPPPPPEAKPPKGGLGGAPPPKGGAPGGGAPGAKPPKPPKEGKGPPGKGGAPASEGKPAKAEGRKQQS